MRRNSLKSRVASDRRPSLRNAGLTAPAQDWKVPRPGASGVFANITKSYSVVFKRCAAGSSA